MSALVFEGVALALGGHPVLRGVDLTLAPGELVAIAGCNGAGKTTLLRLATGLQAPDAGRVMLDGTPVVQLGRRAVARRIAVVPQETRVPFPFSALELVLMGRAPHLGWLGFESSADVARAEAALAALDVAHLAERAVPSLSGGERQLVTIARALAQAAPVLLLDEPTASLDLRHRAHVLARVREAVDTSGCAAAVVTHDLDLAARHCDRMALLAEGRVAVEGPPSAVLTPAHLRTAFGLEVQVVTAPDGLPVVVPAGARAGSPPRAPGC